MRLEDTEDSMNKTVTCVFFCQKRSKILQRFVAFINFTFFNQYFYYAEKEVWDKVKITIPFIYSKVFPFLQDL